MVNFAYSKRSVTSQTVTSTYWKKGFLYLSQLQVFEQKERMILDMNGHRPGGILFTTLSHIPIECSIMGINVRSSWTRLISEGICVGLRRLYQLH